MAKRVVMIDLDDFEQIKHSLRNINLDLRGVSDCAAKDNIQRRISYVLRVLSKEE